MIFYKKRAAFTPYGGGVLPPPIPIPSNEADGLKPIRTQVAPYGGGFTPAALINLPISQDVGATHASPLHVHIHTRGDRWQASAGASPRPTAHPWLFWAGTGALALPANDCRF